jgi:hypothetical protein
MAATGEDARGERVMAGPADDRPASPVHPDKSCLGSRQAPRSRFIRTCAVPHISAGLTTHRTARPDHGHSRFSHRCPRTPELHFGRHCVALQRGRCATRPVVCVPGHDRGLRRGRPPRKVTSARPLSFDSNPGTVVESCSAAPSRPGLPLIPRARFDRPDDRCRAVATGLSLEQ